MNETILKAGVARQIITPPPGIYLIGYGDRSKGNRGVHDDLTATALALEDGSLRYRLSRRPAHHHHLVCTVCGDVEDFADCDLAALSKELTRRTAYEIRGHWLEMYGLCPDCRAPAAAK